MEGRFATQCHFIGNKLGGYDRNAWVGITEICNYMMGDNRNNSVDSRFFGEIPESSIVGRISRVLFSVKNKKRILKRIE